MICERVLSAALLLHALASVQNIPCANAADLDEDGLDDAVEHQLLQQYAPQYFFHEGEDTRPADVEWFIMQSELSWSELVLLATHSELSANPYLPLEQQLQLDNETVYSSYVHTKVQTDFLLQLVNEDVTGHGQPWCTDMGVPCNIGLYGHVVLNPGNHDEILVQYWQFFAFSDDQGPFGGGNHQGDWLYLDVYVSRLDHSLIRLVYHHHGDGSECPVTVCPGDDCVLPPDGVPKCYLENGTHEWWPFGSEGGECGWGAWPFIWENDGHNGRGPSFRTSDIRNLGETRAPMPDNDGINTLVLHFNGEWGDPPGPTLRGSAWPEPPLVTAYVDANSSTTPDGSGYHPYTSVQQAYDNVVALPWSSGILRVAAGSYNEQLVLNKPLTLEVWGTGQVTIGN